MTVRYDVAAGVARITLARPERRNAFDEAMIASITKNARDVPAEVRAVVFDSEGEVFCAGADLDWMRGTLGRSREENRADSRGLAEMYAALDALPMPLIVRVQGAAFGGALGFIAVGDVVVASTAATFAFTEVRVGILPSVVSPYVVRRTGPAFATAAFVTGARFDARRALEVGLVDVVVEPAALDRAVDGVLDDIRAGAPGAVRAAKRLVREIAWREPADVRELTVERIADHRVSDEGQEGMRAFLEKRRARWHE